MNRTYIKRLAVVTGDKISTEIDVNKTYVYSQIDPGFNHGLCYWGNEKLSAQTVKVPVAMGRFLVNENVAEILQSETCGDFGKANYLGKPESELENEKTVHYISYPNISVTHGTSTRIGGVSQGAYASLNIGASTPDVPQRIHENRLRLGAAVGMPVVSILNMVHGVNVVRVDTLLRNTKIGDACITNVPNLPLMITTADCVPILFHDPVKKAVGLAHGGWRGTLQGIAGITVKELQKNYSCEPKNLQVAIGPSIGPCCFEVGSEVSQAFENTKIGKELTLKNRTKSISISVDLWRANVNSLLQAGVQLQNICVSRLCTHCGADSLFSYRRDNKVTGRLASVIMLNQG